MQTLQTLIPGLTVENLLPLLAVILIPGIPASVFVPFSLGSLLFGFKSTAFWAFGSCVLMWMMGGRNDCET